MTRRDSALRPNLVLMVAMLLYGLWSLSGDPGHAVTSIAPLPPPEQLFACTLDGPSHGFTPRRRWKQRRVNGTPLMMHLPGTWKVTGQRGIGRVESTDGRVRIRIRIEDSPEKRSLRDLREVLEATEVGKSHMGERCGERIAREIKNITGFDRVLVTVHGRPLGERRRNYVLYLNKGTLMLSVVVTIRWNRDADGPELDLVRRLMGSLRAPPA